jgi:precorrin-6Y C5,15-methyltransferase (decarboxylating)
MMIFNDQPLDENIFPHGFPDELFIRGDVPMTKQEVRAVSLSKLQLAAADIVYDIGAGTGSVSVEAALKVRKGMVWALEKDPGAVEIIEKNKKKFGAANMKIMQTAAPAGLETLPSPDKVFIGGSGGNLKEILNLLYRKNPEARIVINAVTLETLNQAVDYYRTRPAYDLEIVHIIVAKARSLGGLHLMTGQNPVYILTASKKF